MMTYLFDATAWRFAKPKVSATTTVHAFFANLCRTPAAAAAAGGL
jgi:hypothetical protein